MPEINLKLRGLSDLPPWELGLADGAYSELQNVTFRRGFADRVAGESLAISTGQDTPQNLLNVFSLSSNNWVITAIDTVQVFDGTPVLDDITPGGWASLPGKGSVSSSLLNGYAIVNVTNQVAGWSWLPGDASLTALPNSPNCRAIRALGNFLVGFDTEQSVATTDWIVSEETVAWSDASEDIPATWIPAVGNQAGSIRLGATTGPVIDGSALRGRTMLVGKSDALYLMDFVGGQSIFSFRLLTNKTGILSRNCMTLSFEGKIYGMSASDFWVSDGSNVQSIADNKVRRTYVENLAEDGEGSFCVVNAAEREVWFCPVTENGWIERAYVYDIDANVFGLRLFANLAHASTGINSVTVDDSWAGGSADDWDTGPDVSWNFATTSPQLQLLAQIDAVDTGFSWTDLNPDTRFAGVERAGIKGDSDRIMTCSRIWIDGELPADGLTVIIGARYADADNYIDANAVTIFPGDRWVSVMSKGRDFRVQIGGVTAQVWSIQRIGLDLADSGGRF